MPHAGTGARGASDIPSWREYLASRSRRGRASRGRSRRGGASFPSFPEPEPDPVQQARESYESTKAKAESYGVDTSPDTSFLEKVGRFVDYPGAAVRSGVRELVDALDSDPGTEASFEDFREQLDARKGSGTLFGALQTEDDDPLLERGAKYLGSFVSDVALDPLSFLFGGGSIMGKRAATEAISNQVARKATKLGDDKLSSWATKQLVKEGSSEKYARQVMKNTGEKMQKTLPGMADEATAAASSQRLGRAAAEAYTEGGRTGLRRFLEDFGDEGMAIWDDLPADLKGGLRIGAPFTTASKKVGPDDFAERLGLGGIMEASHTARNWVRSSMVGRAVADTFGGRWGKDYGDYVASMTTRRMNDVAEIAARGKGRRYARYIGMKNADDAARRAGFKLGKHGQDLLSSAEERIAAAAKPDEAREWYERYFLNPEQLRQAKQAKNGLDENQLAGLEAANWQRMYLEEEVLPMMRNMGIEVGDIGPNYVPRVMMREEKVKRAAKAKTARGGGSTYDPTTSRNGAYLVWDDSKGEYRWLNPKEANEASERLVFETDPTRIMGNYLAATRSKVMGSVFRRGMERLGLIFDEVPEAAGRAYKKLGKSGVKLPEGMEGKWAPAEITDAMHRHFQMLGKRDSGFEKFADNIWNPFMTVWKASKTVARGPGYHTRNVMGGMYNNWLARVPIKSHHRAARVVAARRKAVRDAKKQLGDQEEPLTIWERADELLQERLSDDLYELHDKGRTVGLVAHSRSRELPTRNRLERLGDAELQDALRHGGGSGARYGEEAGRVGRVADKVLATKWVRGGQTAAEVSEEYLRLAAFDEGLRRYGADNIDDAVKLAHATQFDYSDLSPAEATIRNNWAPFFVWTKNNVPLQARAIFHEPGKLNRLLHAKEEAEEAFSRDDFDGVIPEWMKERMAFATNLSFGGNPVVMGVEAPAIDLNQWIETNEGYSGAALNVANEMANMLGPFQKQAAEVATGSSLFTGAPHPEGGVQAPLSLRYLPGIRKRTDEEGEVRVPAWMASIATDVFPFVGELERYVLSLHPDSKYHDRWATNMHAFAGPLPGPTMTLTPEQETGELIGRSMELSNEIQWADVSPEERARIERLVDSGVPHKIAAGIVLDK